MIHNINISKTYSKPPSQLQVYYKYITNTHYETVFLAYKCTLKHVFLALKLYKFLYFFVDKTFV